MQVMNLPVVVGGGSLKDTKSAAGAVVAAGVAVAWNGLNTASDGVLGATLVTAALVPALKYTIYTFLDNIHD